MNQMRFDWAGLDSEGDCDTDFSPLRGTANRTPERCAPAASSSCLFAVLIGPVLWLWCSRNDQMIRQHCPKIAAGEANRHPYVSLRMPVLRSLSSRHRLS